MAKKFLRSGQVSDAGIYVEEAARWARSLVHSEARGPGDHENAMRRVARRLHVPFNTLWRLHYRKPKTIGAEIFCALGEAINDNQRRWKEEREHLEPTTTLGRALLGAADWLAREEKEEGLNTP
jgi:hypothetical protein